MNHRRVNRGGRRPASALLAFTAAAVAAMATAVAPAVASADVFADSSPKYEIPFAGPSGPAITFWWHIVNNTAGQNMAVCFRDTTDAGTWSYPSDGDPYGGSFPVPPTSVTGQPDRSCQYVGPGVNTQYHYRADAATTGHVYSFCAKEYDQYSNIGWQPSAIPAECPGSYYTNASYDGATLTGIAVTTVKPTSPISIDGGTAVTRDPLLHIRIGYANALSVPAWPASFICLNTSRDCVNGDGAAFSYDQTCSSYPASGDSCTRTYSGADGVIHACTRVADAAVPDQGEAAPFNSSAPTATASYANLSDATCASILLDRAPPTLTAQASTVTPRTGETVNFSASATDAGSGPDGSYSWTFGDGGQASGATTTHAYTTAGTYTVTVSTHDRAGNAASTSLMLMAKDPPAGSGGSTGSSGGSTGSSGGSTGSSGGSTGSTGSGPGGTVAPGTGPSLPPASGSVSAPGTAATAVAPPTSSAVAGEGSSGTQTATVRAGSHGSLAVLVPRNPSLLKLHGRLIIRVTAPRPGTATLVLTVAHHRPIRVRVVFRSAGALGVAFRLPAGIRPGAGVLRIRFVPGAAGTSTLRMTFRR